MNILSFQHAPPADLGEGLDQMERQFLYPLGPGRYFRISHSEDYPRFFRSIGEGICWVAERDGHPLGVLGAAIRTLGLPDGSQKQVLYLGDLKIIPSARGGMALPRLADAARRWVGKRVDAAFGVVMNGTTVIPAGYTGRLGIPQFTELGKVWVLRVMPGAHDPSISAFGELMACGEVTMEAGTACYQRLTLGGYSSPGGTPAGRSLIPPVWLMDEPGNACGRLEDTRQAKRLISDDGIEIVSAHLSCFARQDARSGASLIWAALNRALKAGIPALFVATPETGGPELIARLESLGLAVIVAPATVFGTGCLSGPAWNINTAEI